MEKELTFAQAARIYFTLQALSGCQFNSFKLTYRISRNIEKLKRIGEKFIEDLKEASGDEKEISKIQKAEEGVWKEWEGKGESDKFDLMLLDFSGEDKSLPAPAPLSVLLPILEEPKD